MTKLHYHTEDSMRNAVVYILSPNQKNRLQMKATKTKTLQNLPSVEY